MYSIYVSDSNMESCPSMFVNIHVANIDYWLQCCATIILLPSLLRRHFHEAYTLSFKYNHGAIVAIVEQTYFSIVGSGSHRDHCTVSRTFVPNRCMMLPSGSHVFR